MADPGSLLRREPLEDAGAVGDLDCGGSVLAFSLGDHVPAQKVCHELHAVADAEHRKVSVDDSRVDARCALVVHARGPA